MSSRSLINQSTARGNRGARRGRRWLKYCDIIHKCNNRGASAGHVVSPTPRWGPGAGAAIRGLIVCCHAPGRRRRRRVNLRVMAMVSRGARGAGHNLYDQGPYLPAAAPPWGKGGRSRVPQPQPFPHHPYHLYRLCQAWI